MTDGSMCLARDGTTKLTRFLVVVIFQIRRCRTISCAKKVKRDGESPKILGQLSFVLVCVYHSTRGIVCTMLHLFLGEATSEGATCVQTKTEYPQNTLKYTDKKLSVTMSVTFIFCQSTSCSVRRTNDSRVGIPKR